VTASVSGPAPVAASTGRSLRHSPLCNINGASATVAAGGASTASSKSSGSVSASIERDRDVLGAQNVLMPGPPIASLVFTGSHLKNLSRFYAAQAVEDDIDDPDG
jgi:hypothetical protein